MSRFLLVPGGWHGAWVYEDVVELLGEAGHDAQALTLAGLGPEQAGKGAPPNLDTHIAEVEAALDATDEPTILAGHSYAGMVITGVADRIPTNLAALIYIDAYLPADGDSCWSLATDRFREIFISGAGDDGLWVRPGERDPRARPHPLASLVQQIRLTRPDGPPVPRDYIYLSGWRGTPFTETYRRLRRDPAWHTHELPGRHNVALEQPRTLTELLCQIAARTDDPAADPDNPKKGKRCLTQ